MAGAMEPRRRTEGKVSGLVLLGLVALAVGVFLIWLCFNGNGPPPPAPLAGCPQNSPPSDTTQLRACLNDIEFDTVPVVGDEQRLMVVASGPGPACRGDTTLSCRYGPLAKIEPVMAAHAYDSTAIDEGRIIARMFLRAGETESYPKFGLTPNPDTTYWFVVRSVDSSYFVTKTARGAGLAITARPLVVEPHDEGTFEQAAARWIWVETDEKANGPCGSACCR